MFLKIVICAFFFLNEVMSHVTVTVMSIGVDCKNVPAEPSLIVLLTYRSLVGLCKQEVTNGRIIASKSRKKSLDC